MVHGVCTAFMSCSTSEDAQTMRNLLQTGSWSSEASSTKVWEEGIGGRAQSMQCTVCNREIGSL